MTSNLKPTLIVGVGASAGGLKPIEEFFSHMLTDNGMAFVIVQHLSPDFKSLMGELLKRHTGMSIHRVTDGITLAANSIYLIPPKKDLTIADGKLMLGKQQRTRGLNLPIDSFFDSLSEQIGDEAVAIVLSGSGSDGSHGIVKVREAGGLVLVQTPEDAGFDGMPRAAIDTKAVDLICSVREMPGHLIEYAIHRNRETVQQYGGEFVADSTLSRLCKFYKERNGIDFSYYKPGTIYRRLERRTKLATVASTEEYLKQVESDQTEANSLFRDLLVEVTHFFRDAEAFAILQKTIIPNLIKESTGSEFRAWVCGCATGEEAYSIAMVIHQCMEQAGKHKKPFKVFATDVHAGSVEIAGKGFYRNVLSEKLPESFRKKYFVETEDGFKVKPEIRQNVIFAVNDATKDPPFTRLDFVSCRNMLIYLLPQVQKRILSVFHFGLKAKGVLFLGPSETVGELVNEFDEIDRHWRVFRKRRDVRLAEATRGSIMSGTPGIPQSGHARTNSLRDFKQQNMANAALNRLLNRYLPSSLLVDEYNELIHCIGDARKLLTLPEGQPTNNLFQLLGSDLSVPVSAALHRCRKQSETIAFNGVRIQMPGSEEELYQLKVESLEERSETLYLVSFSKLSELEVPAAKTFEFKPLENAGDQIDQLKMELNYTRETLQATVEELESSNEELQATNEELIASNEELQSTNEELQSTNEELHTVNQENRYRIDQLNEVTEDLELLLSRTATGILFLDQDLRIRKFTRSITRYFDLKLSDIGRDIDNFNHRTGVKNLYAKLREALDTGSELTMESKQSDRDPLLIEVALKNEQGVAAGIMLTIGKKIIQGFGVASRQFLLPVGAGFWHWPDLKKDTMWWSPMCYQLLGLQAAELAPVFSSWRDLVHPEDEHRLKNAGSEQCVFVKEGYLAVRMKCADGEYRKFEYRAAFVMDEHDKPKSMMGSFSPILEPAAPEPDSTEVPRPKFLAPVNQKNHT